MVLKEGGFDPAAYARWFETDLGRLVWSDERRALDHVLGPIAGIRVLDVGCGDGRLSIELARAGARVTAVDRSAVMLRAAVDRAMAETERIQWVRSDGGSLPFVNGCFDVSVAVTVLCFAHDPIAIVREMARVTRPGGRVVLGELGRWSTWALHRRWRASRRGGTWEGTRFWTRGELCRLLSASGLRPAATAAAVFYPRSRTLARICRRSEPWLGQRVSFGAAFLVASAGKPG